MNSLLPFGKPIGFSIAKTGEPMTDGFPEVTGAVGFERRQELGQDLVTHVRAAHAR